MSSIDSRVVEMKFNNAQFQQGIASTLSSLEKLKAGLSLGGAAKGMQNLGTAAKNVDMASLAASVDGVSARFSALSVAGTAALATIASKAVSAGVQLVKSFSMDQVMDGFSDYELKIGATQTIMAGTGESIGNVTKYLKELDIYADETIYNLSDMVSNISKFTNAGVKLPVAVGAMKGVANLAALSGASTEYAAMSMRNFGDAIGSGTMRLIDWRSIDIAGMGTMEFKQQLIDSGVAMGTLKKATDGSIKSTKGHVVNTKNFKDTLQDEWVTAEVLTGTLNRYADANSKIGKKAYAAAKDVKTFSMMMTTLKAAAGTGWTDSFQQVIGNLPEATKMWTDLTNTIGGVIGKSAETRNRILQQWNKKGGRIAFIDTFKNAWAALSSVVKPIQEAFREIFPVKTGEQLRNMTVAIRDFMKSLILNKESMENLKRTFKGVFAVFSIVWAVIKGIASTFMTLFGVVNGGTGGFLALTAVAGDFLSKINDWVVKSGAIKSFFDNMNTAKENVLVPLVAFVVLLAKAFAALFSGDISGFTSKLGDAFGGLGAIFDGIKANIANTLGRMSGFAGSIGRNLSGMGTEASASIGALLETISVKIQAVKDRLTGMIPKFDTSGMEKVSFNTDAMSGVGDKASGVWDKLVNALKSVGALLEPIGASIGQFFGAISDKLTAWVKDLGFEDAVALMNTGMFMLMYKSLSSVGKKLGAVGDSISGAFDQLTNTLTTMQQAVKAKIILSIAIAVGILVLALVLLANIDAKKLAAGLGGIGVLMLMLTKVMGALMPMLTEAGTVSPKVIAANAVKIVAAGVALVLLSVAVLILASALKKMSDISWPDMIKGLIGVGALLAGLAIYTKYAEANQGGIKSSAGLILLAIAIRLLVSSVSELGKMDVGTLIKGITALGVMLVMLSGMVKVVNGTTGMIQAAAGILILSIALMALSLAVRIYAAIDYATMIKGLLLMVVTLGTIGVAMNTFPKNMPATAAGLLIVSGALMIIAGVLKILGGMSLGEIIKSIVTLALALGIIVVATNMMTTAMAGAQAMIVVSAALFIFANVMKILGSLSWEAIGKGLVAIAGLFVVLGLAGLVLGPVVPVLFALGVALMLLGGAMLVAGLGFSLFATGFAVLAAVGTAGFAVLTAGFISLMGLIPLFAAQLGLGMVAMAKVLGDNAPVLVAALVKILLALFKALDTLIPKALDTAVKFITALVNKLVTMIPMLASAGLKIILGLLKAVDSKVYMIVTTALSIVTKFLNAIADGLPKIIAAGVNIIVKFIKGIGDSIPKLLQAGADLILKFVRGLSAAIDKNATAMGEAGGKLAVSIVKGMVKGLGAAAGQVVQAAKDVASKAWKAFTDIFKPGSPSRTLTTLGIQIDQGLALGMDRYSDKVSESAKNVGVSALDAMRKSISGMAALVDADVDINPRITPILDLTGVKKDASLLGSILTAKPITLGASYAKAKDASSGYNANQSILAQVTAQATPKEGVTFVQNNTSPKALSSAEIYRMTKNQLSVAKGALTT